jgi:sec-independent protein translocase protein TatC
MNDERRMTIVEHLTELRRVLIVSLIAWFVTTIVAFFFHNQLLDVLLHPLRVIAGSGATANQNIFHGVVYTGPLEGLSIPLKVAATVGFVGALPVILQQVWSFVAPGLRPTERKFVWPFVLSALVLFLAGAAFAYFVMPIGLNFIANFLGGTAIYLPDLNQYLSFFLLLVMIFGVTFEMPIALVMLGLIGIISSSWLRKRRRGAYVMIIFAAFVVTPGADPFTPTALAIPLLIFYEASIQILKRVFHR